MLGEIFEGGSDRRQFLTKIIPVCTAACMGLKSSIAHSAVKETLFSSQEGHKFDQPMERQLTYRQYMTAQNREYIELVKSLEGVVGKEKLLEHIKELTAARLFEMSKRFIERLPGNKLTDLSDVFKSPMFANTLTMDFVEETETVFELKVTECISASVFLAADAGDIGYATACWGDYAMAEGFNSKIKMVRDKTLMQGHTYCNHRYIYSI